MRRSAAPSQYSSNLKRPRFIVPFSKPCLEKNVSRSCDREHLSVNMVSNANKLKENIPVSHPGKEEDVRSAMDVLKLLNKPLVTNTVLTDESSHKNKSVSDSSHTEKISEDSSFHCRLKQNTVTISGHGKEEVRSTADVLKLLKMPTVMDTVLMGESRPQSDCLQASKVTESLSVTSNLNEVLDTLHLPSDRDKQGQIYPEGETSVSQLDNSDSPVDKQGTNESRYYSVMWCKLSKKKHKKWEGDAVLIVRRRTAVLKNLDGKEIGRGTGYKVKELESLEDGQTLVVGGKECEIQNPLPESDYVSGKCFEIPSYSTPLELPTIKKPFVRPSKPGAKTLIPPTSSLKLNPRHPIDGAGALVMPRPSSAHQWQFNKGGLHVVDVVVDPILTAHLRPHQREGVVFLYECVMGMREFNGQGAILADEMGLGKTLQCITLIWTMYKQGPYGGCPVLKKALIVTPSTLIKNWVKEFRKWLGKDKLSLYAVDQNNKVQDFIHSPLHAVLIISYEMYVRHHDILAQVSFDLLICDEGHRLKNTGIKTTNVINNQPVKRRVLLTGTPVQNDLQEFFSLVEFCNPGVLGTPASFRRLFEDPIIKSNQPSASSEEKCVGEARAAELARLTSLFVLRRTQEVINKYLPGKVEYVVFCRPTELQLALYQQILTSRVLQRCLSLRGGAEDPSHLVCISALRKLCNHPHLLYKRAKEILSVRTVEGEEESLYQHVLSEFPSDFEQCTFEENSGKLRVLSRLMFSLNSMGSKEKIVLVSCFTKTLDVLQQMCVQYGYSFLRLDGSTPSSKRQELVDSFNAPYSNHSVFLLSSKAGGTGLNLIGASRILLYDIDWNPANDLQAMARVWRDGQKRQVRVYRLLTTGTIEEKIYQRQVTKQGLSGKVVDSKDACKVQFSKEDLKDIFSLHKSSTSTTHDILGCTCCDSKSPSETILKGDASHQERLCQLGVSKKVSLVKHTSMAELLEWDHIPGPIDPDTFEDKSLAMAGQEITFVFRNKCFEPHQDSEVSFSDSF
ncbi:DNA repair and recombination protein RAD54B-like [Tachypleus tridentatus]|uniref:DNA repair and recombination protein RAD54B-like n=1 Tax=Tachypleus tridentatus TaxID=6853 RepID=UPI003FD6BD6B